MLLVIADHAGVRTVAGGFVGVDSFFVISGFLITGLLLREIASSGRVSILDFYARRARRILPAAVLVLLATTLGSVLLLPLVRAVDVLHDSVWAALFGANIHFALVGTDYFAKDEPVSPLQHFWSLAVEEQYYLVWPLLVVAVVLAVRRRGTTVTTALLSTAVVLSLASLVWSVVATAASPTTAYFSTFTRAWELGVGCITAILVTRLPRPRRLTAQVVPAVGLLAILVTAVTFDGRTAAPGWAVALPVVGTALVLGVVDPQSSPVLTTRLLSLRPAQAIGNWSYSMYLWHFVVLVFLESELDRGRLDPLEKLAVLGVVVALGAVTYRLVEEPFRRGRWLVGRPWRTVALYPAGVALVVASALGGRVYVGQQLTGNDDVPAVSTNDYARAGLSEDPRTALVEASVLAARQDRAVPSRLEPPLLGIRRATAPLGDCDYRTGTHRLCAEGDPDADRVAVVVGDSFARAWAPAVERIGARLHYRTYALVLSGCSPTTAVRLDGSGQRVLASCSDFYDWVQQVVTELHPDLIVVASSALGPLRGPDGTVVRPQTSPNEFQRLSTEGFRAQLDRLRPHTDQLAVIAGTPALPREPGVCLSAGDTHLGDCLFAPEEAQGDIQRAFLRQAADVGARPVDVERWFCADGACPSVVGRTITLRDKEHVTPTYARSLAPPIARAMGLLTSR